VRRQCLGLKDLGVSLTILADSGDDHGWVHTARANHERLHQVRYHHIPTSRRQRLLPALRLLALGPPSGLLRRLALLNPWYGGMEAACLRLLLPSRYSISIFVRLRIADRGGCRTSSAGAPAAIDRLTGSGASA
jgi:hypothetical protein